ncbi:MAG: response regulator, partial [Atopobiaceae bacterium]|nr:response regulator [Atopobiaceae bacterium]
MNGDIEVESEKGVGSTFTVTVTLRVSSRAASKEQGIVLPHDIRAITIDDDAIACEHAQLVLRSLGIDADVSTSPKAAVEQIRAAYGSGKSYGLILTDYKMAEMDGLKLVREVRSFDKGESAILLLTGYSYDGIEEEARATGVDDVVGKPLEG